MKKFLRNCHKMRLQINDDDDEEGDDDYDVEVADMIDEEESDLVGDKSHVLLTVKQRVSRLTIAPTRREMELCVQF